MATRFYPDPTNTPTVSPDFVGISALGVWHDTTQAVRRKLALDTPGNNASTNFTVTEINAGINYVLVAQFVSEPLEAMSSTIDFEAMKASFLCFESAAKSDASLFVSFAKCDQDGSNAAAIDSLGYINDTTEFYDGGYVNRYGLQTLSAQNGSISANQRLIIEVGVKFSNYKTAEYGGSINITDNHATTDLPENDTETAAYNSWIETGDTFTEASTGGPWEASPED